MGEDEMMRGGFWRSWVGAVVVGLGVVATVPAGAEGPPGQKAGAEAAQAREILPLLEEVNRLLEQEKYDEAVPLAERAVSISEKWLGPDHPIVATILDILAARFGAKRDYARAEPLFQRALHIREKALGPNHVDVAESLNNLATLYLYKGDYARAESLFERALRINEKALGPDHPNVAIVLNSLARLYSFKADYAHAEPLFERALRIREKALGPDHPDIGTSLNNLALLYYAMGDYTRAEPLFERALRIGEKALGPDHPNVSTFLNNLALLYYARGDYVRAEPLYERALRIKEKALGPDHPDVATSLNSLAELYRAKGDYAHAEPLFERALRIKEKALEPDHPDIAISLNNLAMLYHIKGDDAHAEPLLERALRIKEKALGPEHPDVAISLGNLALLYEDKGDYARAEPLFERALRITEKALGANHPKVATFLDNLAELCKAKGDYAHAEPLLERALRIREKALGPEHEDVAISLNNLAVLYQDKGDYALTEPLFERALRIREKALGPEHADVATSLNNLAVLYQDRGDYALAEPLLERALRITEKALGPNHPKVATFLDNLMVLYLAQGRFVDAVHARQRGSAIEEKNATRVLATGSERQRRAYVVTLTDRGQGTISLHVQHAPSDVQAARLALTTILRRKGRVLDAMADSLATIRGHLTHDDQNRLDRLSSVMSQIGVQLSRGPGELPTEQYKKNLQELEGERQTLEEELGKRSAEFGVERQPLTLEQVQQSLPEGAALLELFRYKPFDPKVRPSARRWAHPRYVAYVLRRSGEPSFTDLGEAASIDATVAWLRAELADPDKTHDPRPAARALDALVMQPIRALLGTTRWVLLSPDSDLNLIPFEALVDEQGRYLIERFAFTYLTSGRDLIRLQTHAAPRQGPLVIADPDYGTFGAATKDPSQDTAQRGLRSVDMTQARFPPLHSTSEEARAVARDLPGAQVLLQKQATEGAIKAARAPSILHLATHGFFLPREAEDERPAGPGLEPTPQQIAAAMQRENPLLRAGLALAGANARVSGDKDDGILTALEVSGLDLHGTKLVVLSACQTGLGDAVSGEGVYGLRRALVMAGAETQVMSLWEVDTGHTRELMEAYYERLKAGAGRSEALRQAQLAMLANKETSHPNLWASFIVSGDWRTLEEAPAVPDLRVHPGPRGCACAQMGAAGAGSWPGGLVMLGLAAAAARRRRRGHRRGVMLGASM